MGNVSSLMPPTEFTDCNASLSAMTTASAESNSSERAESYVAKRPPHNTFPLVEEEPKRSVTSAIGKPSTPCETEACERALFIDANSLDERDMTWRS